MSSLGMNLLSRLKPDRDTNAGTATPLETDGTVA